MLTIDEEKMLSEHDFKFITMGCNSNIYRDGDMVYKKYTQYANENYRIKEKMFEELKKIDYDFFIKLYDLFVGEDNKVNSYTCNYIKETKEYLTRDDLQMIFNCLNEMQKDFIHELSSKNILMDDPNTSNLLISDNKLVIIDPDCYFFGYNDYERNLEHNKETLLQYIYYKCILTNIKKPSECIKNLDGILDIKINPKTNLCKELKRVIK